MKKSTLLLLASTVAFVSVGRLVEETVGILFIVAGAIQATAALISALPRKNGRKKD